MPQPVTTRQSAGFLPPIDAPVADYIRPAIIVIAFSFLFALPFIRLPHLTSALTSQFFTLVWVTAFLLALTVWGIWKNTLAVPKHRLFMLVGLWIAAKLLASYFSILPHRSIWGAYTVWSDGLIYLEAILVFGWVLLAVRLRNVEITTLIHLFLIQSFLVSWLVLLEVTQLGIDRPGSPFLNSDYFISYACLILPLSIILFLKTLRLSIKTTRDKIATLLYGIQLIVLVTALLVSLPLYLQEPFSTEKSVLPAKTVEILPETPSVKGFLNTRANIERWNEWRLGMAIGRDRPWLGSGPGTTLAAMNRVINTTNLPGWDFATGINHPHNDLIEQFSQTGLIGLVTYLALWIGLAIITINNRSAIQASWRPYALGLGLGLGLFFIFNLFLFTTVATGILWIVWLALMLQLSGGIQMVRDHSPWVKVFLTSVLIVAAATSLVAWQYFRAHQLLGQAIYAGSANLTGLGRYSSLAGLRFPAEAEFTHAAAINNLPIFLKQSFKTPDEKHAFGQVMIDFATQATNRNPFIPKFVIDQGVVEYAVAANPEDQARARTTIAKGLAMAPKDYSLYVRAGDSLTNIGEYDLAKDYLGQALKLTDKHTETIQQRLRDLERVVR